jgi:hypothetical protein
MIYSIADDLYTYKYDTETHSYITSYHICNITCKGIIKIVTIEDLRISIVWSAVSSPILALLNREIELAMIHLSLLLYEAYGIQMKFIKQSGVFTIFDTASVEDLTKIEIALGW